MPHVIYYPYIGKIPQVYNFAKEWKQTFREIFPRDEEVSGPKVKATRIPSWEPSSYQTEVKTIPILRNKDQRLVSNTKGQSKSLRKEGRYHI